MSLFSMQQLHCPVCSKEFEHDFNLSGGYGREMRCCSKECWDELEWRRSLALLGRAYSPRPAPRRSEASVLDAPRRGAPSGCYLLREAERVRPGGQVGWFLRFLVLVGLLFAIIFVAFRFGYDVGRKAEKDSSQEKGKP